MRPGQQNKRGRGRSNNNNNNNNNNGRKGGNPLSRTYDSSGPDVKIRGTAQHIAEKYSNLARDAQSSSDNVMAENYLQHAEHYNRIIAAAQAQMQERFQREDRDSNERDDDRDERETGEHSASGERGGNGHDRGDYRGRGNDPDQDTSEQPSLAHINGSGPQPVIEGTPAEVAMDDEASAGSRRASGRRRNAAPRPRRQPRQDEASSGDDAKAAKSDVDADGAAKQEAGAADKGDKGQSSMAVVASE